MVSPVYERVLAEFPPHVSYVEVFAGAAWVLFGKDPATSKCEVLNNLDGELVNFWRVVKHRPAEFAERVSQLLSSRELFAEWRPHGGLRRVKRPNLHWITARSEIRTIMRRLQVVWIERLPWEKCIQQYDAATTFFYVDPPLPQLVVCKAVKGKWLLS